MAILNNVLQTKRGKNNKNEGLKSKISFKIIINN